MLKELQKNFISNSPNLTDIDLSYNSLENLHDGSFSGISGLSHLDLSHNQVWIQVKVKHCFNFIFQLTFVGSIFKDLNGQDLVVDLTNNSLRFLPGKTKINNISEKLLQLFKSESDFKPFIEKKRKGYVNLINNELLCGCEIQVRRKNTI